MEKTMNIMKNKNFITGLPGTLLWNAEHIPTPYKILDLYINATVGAALDYHSITFCRRLGRAGKDAPVANLFAIAIHIIVQFTYDKLMLTIYDCF
ncbi:hypothetical protein KIN20_009059 [Parelaphostrongylus tenuis]|uniref:Uncharacterized protein n=1 Tax=Parelaphostrongylus tenuis TaxID=148309 RepID=A0AAD5QL14_PARTN|nr:hypothetical protein KIN20_009059 [Parelaphostrongylus tenuis]